MSAPKLLDVRPTILEGLMILEPRYFGDARGWFCETFNARRMQEAGIYLDFVQDNQSFSAEARTIRGLHFQAPPCAQDKLVRVLGGAILDVAVDLRSASPTFGQHFSLELSAKNGLQLLVPKGFAHGFVTREANTTVFYKVTNYYDRECDKGLAFDDPDLDIDWGIGSNRPIISGKDRAQPRLGDLETPF